MSAARQQQRRATALKTKCHRGQFNIIKSHIFIVNCNYVTLVLSFRTFLYILRMPFDVRHIVCCTMRSHSVTVDVCRPLDVHPKRHDNDNLWQKNGQSPLCAPFSLSLSLSFSLSALALARLPRRCLLCSHLCFHTVLPRPTIFMSGRTAISS